MSQNTSTAAPATTTILHNPESTWVCLTTPTREVIGHCFRLRPSTIESRLQHEGEKLALVGTHLCNMLLIEILPFPAPRVSALLDAIRQGCALGRYLLSAVIRHQSEQQISLSQQQQQQQQQQVMQFSSRLRRGGGGRGGGSLPRDNGAAAAAANGGRGSPASSSVPRDHDTENNNNSNNGSPQQQQQRQQQHHAYPDNIALEHQHLFAACVAIAAQVTPGEFGSFSNLRQESVADLKLRLEAAVTWMYDSAESPLYRSELLTRGGSGSSNNNNSGATANAHGNDSSNHHDNNSHHKFAIEQKLRAAIETHSAVTLEIEGASKVRVDGVLDAPLPGYCIVQHLAPRPPEMMRMGRITDVLDMHVQKQAGQFRARSHPNDDDLDAGGSIPPHLNNHEMQLASEFQQSYHTQQHQHHQYSYSHHHHQQQLSPALVARTGPHYQHHLQHHQQHQHQHGYYPPPGGAVGSGAGAGAALTKFQHGNIAFPPMASSLSSLVTTPRPGTSAGAATTATGSAHGSGISPRSQAALATTTATSHQQLSSATTSMAGKPLTLDEFNEDYLASRSVPPLLNQYRPVELWYVSRQGATRTLVAFLCCGATSTHSCNCQFKLPRNLSRFHSGQLSLIRTTKSQAIKGAADIAVWSCCMRPAAKVNLTPLGYEVVPEEENGCSSAAASGVVGNPLVGGGGGGGSSGVFSLV